MGTVELAFLGAGDAFGSGGRLQTCLHLRGGAGGSLLIDCGATSMVALKRAGIDPGTIGHVVISHLHGDHFAGIPFLVLDGQFSRRDRPLVVAGPPGVGDRVRAVMEVLFPGSTGVTRRFPVEFLELADREPAAVGPAVVTAFTVEHASGAPPYALRVDYAGKRVAYSGDTEWTEALVEAAAGADLFVCEAYQFARKVRYHLDYETLRSHRSRIDCRRIILTHLSGDALARRAEMDLPCAEDGLVLAL